MSRSRPVVFMCSGQGGHHFQMGRELFHQEPLFRESMLRLNQVVLDRNGVSVLSALFDDARTRAEPFETLALTSPAIFMVEFAVATALVAMGLEPDYILGVSMGVFAAAAVGGCLSPEDALTAVMSQASIVERHCRPGSMVAVLADPAVYRAEEALWSNSEIAAINAPSHFVISARQGCLNSITRFLRDNGILFSVLPVGYAFHSRWIDEAEGPLRAYFATLLCRPPEIPIICSAAATTLTHLPGEHFWTVARKPIRLLETVRRMEADGTYHYVDIGPSASLATLLRRTLNPVSGSEVREAFSPYGNDCQKFNSLQALK